MRAGGGACLGGARVGESRCRSSAAHRGPGIAQRGSTAGGRPACPRATVVYLESRPASTLLPNARVVFILCPGCQSRRRALFWVGGRLVCRRCHRLPYQSQTHGHWTGPLVDAMQARCRLLAGAPGPRADAIAPGSGGWSASTARRRRGWMAGSSDGARACAGSATRSGAFED
jgi:hypothetical protein